MLLSDFSHHHIEMACTLLETCGRFLFRSPESHLRTSVLLVREKPVVFCAEGLSCTELNQFFFFFGVVLWSDLNRDCNQHSL